MAGNPKQKLKLLFIADYLKRYTDENHAVQVSDIIDHLASCDISAERKSIYDDINILREYGMPIERGTAPRKGYYLAEETFQLSELMMLIDAVQASPVISQKKTHDLINKLSAMTSVYKSKSLARYRSGFSGNGSARRKSDNEELYYNIDRIHKAITAKKKIRFIYHKRVLVNNLPVFDMGREFIISPYAAVWNQDKYYIVGNYEKYDDLSHYRIDRMKKVELTEMPSRDVSAVSGYNNGLNIEDYTNKVFNMYAGSTQSMVELVCDGRLLESMIERFGINVPYRQLAEGRFSVRAQAVINEGFENWILNFGGGVAVKYPQSLRDSVQEKLRTMLMRYDNPI